MKKNGIYFTSKINYVFHLFIFLLASMILLQNVAAQTLDFFRQNDVSVEVAGKTLQYPWIGGLNNPQFSEVDLNNDGILDLFVFDRAADIPMTFIHTGLGGKDGYEYAPELEENFPTMKNWALMVDYNCDNIADIFTSNQNGIRIYKGYYNDDSKIGFQFVVDKLTYNVVNEIFVSEFDIPAITDVNNDGDIDILTFNVSGGFIEYFENLSVENNFACGDLSDYRILSDCWGSFYEDFFDPILILDTCGIGKISADKSGGKHPGSTLLAVDLDGDTDKEIILGDISFNSMIMATNGGTPNFANMTSQDTHFPSNSTPIDMTTFPAAFSIDVNRDGIKDLLVSPNADAQSNHFECVWYYRNTGTNVTPNFTLQTDTLMVENTIDVSAFSRPTFFDHNGDGLLDLVVGNEGYEIRVNEFSSYLKPALALYENIGTAHQPAFQLVSRDYMQIGKQLFTTQFDPAVESAVLYHPTFGDLDNDGDEDMLIGDGMGYVHYFENKPTMEGIAKFVKKAERMNDDTGAALDVKKRAAPQLVDVNGDDLLDLIVGNNDGKVYYYQNIGSLESPLFKLQNTQWGAVSVRETTIAAGNAIPYMFKLNDGSFRLVVGNDIGHIYLFTDIESHINGGPFTLVTQQIVSPAGLTEASPTTADVDNDGRLDMLVGNLRGGIVWYETESIVDIEENILQNNPFTFYPNPAKNTLYFDWKNSATSFNAPIEVQIYNTLGQLVLTSMVEHKQPELSIEGLASGLYLVEMRVDGVRIGGEKLVME
ncbi:MAG: FG-GAP-like repeat-containing protein [Chitinophagales bacterium]